MPDVKLASKKVRLGVRARKRAKVRRILKGNKHFD